MSEQMIRMQMAARGAEPEDIEDAVAAFTDDRMQRDKDDWMEAETLESA